MRKEKIERLVDLKKRIVSLFKNSDEFKKIFGSLDILNKEFLSLEGVNVTNHIGILQNILRKYRYNPELRELRRLLSEVNLIVLYELTPFLSNLMNENQEIFDEPPLPPSLIPLERQNAMIARESTILNLLIFYSIYASNESNYIDQIIQRLRRGL